MTAQFLLSLVTHLWSKSEKNRFTFPIKLEFCGRLFSQRDGEPRRARKMPVVVASAARGKFRETGRGGIYWRNLPIFLEFLVSVGTVASLDVKMALYYAHLQNEQRAIV